MGAVAPETNKTYIMNWVSVVGLMATLGIEQSGFLISAGIIYFSLLQTVQKRFWGLPNTPIQGYRASLTELKR
jgi:hypothetical protein